MNSRLVRTALLIVVALVAHAAELRAQVPVTQSNPPWSVSITQGGNTATVDGSGRLTTLSVQSGTWTIQPGNTANSTPWLFTISQGGNAAAVNGSGQLSVTCANCSGSGASDVEGSTFTLGTDSIAPMGGYVDETSPTAATEDRMSAPRLTLQRGLHVNPRDAAGAQLFGTATAAGDTMSNPTLGGALNYNLVWNPGTTQWQRAQVSLASELTHDATAPTWTAVVGGVGMLRASAAAPTDVSADNEAVAPWALRNGAQVVQQSYAGTLAATNTGNASGGTPRVVLATDQPALAGMGVGAVGSAVPANANYLAGRAGANLNALAACDLQAPLRMTTATTTELIAAPGAGRIRICSLRVFAEGSTNITIVRGTGTNCGTGTATVDGPYAVGNSTTGPGWQAGVGLGTAMDAGADTSAVCVTSSAAVGVTVFARYTTY